MEHKSIICTPCLSQTELIQTPDLIKWSKETTDQVIKYWRANGSFNKELYEQFKKLKAKKICTDDH
jgi:hypothetical protein